MPENANLPDFSRWVAANGFSILLALYLASTVCLIALALFVFSLARHVRQFSMRCESFFRLAAEQARAAQAQHEYPTAAAQLPDLIPDRPVDAAGGRLDPSVAAAVRKELESLAAGLGTADNAEPSVEGEAQGGATPPPEGSVG